MAIVSVKKRVHFNAAHRLHSNALTTEKNLEVFGKCNNKNGHGHNYIIEVTLKGEVDKTTGMVVNLTELKEIIEEHIHKRFDHKHLNEDVPEFNKLVPTAENIAIVSWNILKQTKLAKHLSEVVIIETEANSCSYSGE